MQKRQTLIGWVAAGKPRTGSFRPAKTGGKYGPPQVGLTFRSSTSVHFTADKHQAIRKEPKPYANKAEMKQQRRLRRGC